MKYINKEYGFTFRPPYLDKFYREEPKGPAIKNENYPAKYIIGAGLDYSAINGAMLIGKYGSLWGVKVSYYNGYKWLENDDFVSSQSKYSIYSEDGAYSHFACGPMSVKWIRHNEQGLGIQITASKRLRVRVIFYPCFNWPSEISIEGSYVKGRSPYVAVIPGEIHLSDTYAVYKNRYQVILDDKPNREYFMAQSYNKPMDSANGAFNEVMMEFIINNYQSSVYLYCAVGDEKILAMDIPSIDKIAKLIESSGDLKYNVNKTYGSGALGKSVEHMFNNAMWNRIYYPYLLDIISTPNRLSLDNNFNLNGLDENISALIASYAFEDEKGEAIYNTAEDKIFALLSAFQIYSNQKDKSNLIRLFSKFTRLYPPNSNLVLDESKEKIEVAYKWDDSPLKENFNEKPMYSLDMSCLKLLAMDILERIAVKFSMAEANAYGEAKIFLKGKINEKFFNEQKGMYLNRYTDDTWAENYGATSFYPLIAGAVTTTEQLKAVIDNLTDKRLFWGKYIIPTLAKTNKEYGKSFVDIKGKRQPYLEYRGAILPYVNYFIYHGLIRYGLDEIASEFALKCVRLWQRQNKKFGIKVFSKYLPNGKYPKGKEYLSSNGNLLTLIGLQSLIDIEYFRDDLKFAIKFGTFAKGAHAVSNLKLMGSLYSVETDNYSTTMLIDNKEVFKSEGGRCIVRHFCDTRDETSFLIYAPAELKIFLNLPITVYAGIKSTLLEFDVPSGKSSVNIIDGKVKVQKIKTMGK